MKTRITVRYVVLSLMLLITVLSIFTPSIHFLKVFSQYILFVMLGFLAVGFLCFIYNAERLMMWSLLCCGILCLHLKQSSNNMLRLPAATASPSIRVSHVSLGNAESDYESVIAYLLSIDADLLSFQELTPDWNQQLTAGLASRFHYIHTLTRLDQYGMGFFSKRPLLEIDTVYYGSIPSLAATIELGDHELCHIISCHGIPPVNQSAFNAISQHFNFISTYIKSQQGNTMVMGDFHLPPWSAEVQRFRNSSNLQDGRRDIHSRNLDGSMSLPRIRVEHILFTDGLECTSFSEMGSPVVGRLGITGTYQLHYEEMAQ